MSTTDLLTLGIAFGGWIVAIFVSIYQIKQNRDQKSWEAALEIEKEKLRKINDHLDSYSELLEIYRLYARQTEQLVKDSKGQFIKDEKGQFVVNKTNLRPEERFEKAIESIAQTDFRGAIAQKIISIRLNNGKIGDLLNEIDPSGSLGKKLDRLLLRTVNDLEDAIASNEIMEIFATLNNADQIRLEIRGVVNDYFRNKFAKGVRRNEIKR